MVGGTGPVAGGIILLQSIQEIGKAVSVPLSQLTIDRQICLTPFAFLVGHCRFTITTQKK